MPPPPTAGNDRLDGSTDLSGPPSSVVRELNRADSSQHGTINISAPPPGGITQQELRPLVSPTALQSTTLRRWQGSRALMLGGLALVVTIAVLVGLRLGGSASAGSAPSADPTVAQPRAVPPDEAAPLAVPALNAAEAPGVLPSVSNVPAPPPAVSSSPTPAAKPAAPPRKPRPATRRDEPSAEELLKHR